MPLNAVALDSSVLIEHFRIKNKDDSLLSRLPLAKKRETVFPTTIVSQSMTLFTLVTTMSLH